MANKKMHPGCLIALIIGVLVFLLVLVHLAIALYFLRAKFEVNEHTYSDEGSVASRQVDAPGARRVKISSADGAFVREGSEQLFGYYRPTTPVISGDFRIEDIVLGSQDEFLSVSSAEDVVGWAPVRVVVASDARGRVNVMPSSYSVVGDKVVFKGHQEQIGDVSFTGTLLLDKVRPYVEETRASTEPVMTGDLTVNGKTYPGVQFTYSPGA